MNPASPGFNSALHARLYRREAQAELTSCGIFLGAGALIFAVLALTGEARLLQSFIILRWIFLLSAAFLVGFALIARKGWWHPAMPFINTGVQLTLISTFFAVVSHERGSSFALSTAIPMLYCLTIAITAFRLNPWLSFFGGVVGAAEMVLVYALVMRPALTPELLASNPTLGWPAAISRVVVLFAIGLACALAAGSLRNQIRQREDDEKRIDLLERTFGRLVAPEVAKQILADENWMHPAVRSAVVMFADLKGFTTYSEGRAPEDVANFLNRCWTLAVDVVERHGGVINKYLGDGFLALFGVPLPLEDPESSAARTASELQAALAPLLEPEGLALCIGIHCGPLIVGGIGSESRCEFTVIGATVNLASRIEGLNRPLETNCLTSQPVAEKISAEWEMKDHGGHKVKGVRGEVGVFELLRRRK